MTQSISQKIKELRMEAGLSKSKLAEQAELSIGYISKLEDGSYVSLSLKSCRGLADGLGMTLKDFLDKLGFLDKSDSPTLEMVNQALRANNYTPGQAEKILSYARFIKKERNN